jgi:hypothetical protein
LATKAFNAASVSSVHTTIFDPAAFLSFRTKSVELFGCLYCRDSEGESIDRQFDMDRFA